MKKALFVAWRSRDPENPSWGPVGRLEYEDGNYRFFYTKGARTLAGFYPFSEMDELDSVYESNRLFPLFSNRLLSKSRPEYYEYLTWSGFNQNTQPDPLAILAINEGQRQTDSIEVFPCPIPNDAGCYENRFFLHGIRWMEEEGKNYIQQLKPKEELKLVPDPQNKYDPFAVAIYSMNEEIKIGYAPRYLAKDILALYKKCDPDIIQLFVERLNVDAPIQHRVLCRMQSCWPTGFRPCSSKEFQPIPDWVSADCGA